MLAANQAVQRVTAAAGRHADGWKQYAPVWRADRQGLLARLAVQRLPSATLEAKACLYRQLGEEVAAAGGEVDIGFLRLASAPLAGAICAEAQLWADALGSLDLAQMDKPVLAVLNNRASALQVAICKAGSGATETAESVHKVVAAALNGAAEAEAACAAAQARIEARSSFISEGALAEQLDAVNATRSAWKTLTAVATAVPEVPPPDAAVPHPNTDVVNTEEGMVAY